MDTIELWNGDTKALIDPMGAWLTNLSDDRGDILFPRRRLTDTSGGKKQRGGMHVCLPNFGPGGDSSLAQHGFGRDMVWQMSDTQPSYARFELAGGPKGDYQTLQATLQLTLDTRSIDVALTLRNTGTTPLRVAPGFHPYFALDRNEHTIHVNGASYTTADLAGTEFFDDRHAMHLRVARRTVAVTSHRLPTWALWTDGLGDYVCVEPTASGNAFLGAVTDNEQLHAGKQQTYSMTIAW